MNIGLLLLVLLFYELKVKTVVPEWDHELERDFREGLANTNTGSAQEG